MGIDASAIARVVGIETTFRDLRGGNILFLPQRIAVVGQGSTASVYDTTKRQGSSAVEVAELYGFGSPLHLAARQLLPVNGDGVGGIPVTFYPLNDAPTSVAASGSITPAGTPSATAAYRVLVNNIPSESFVITAGDTVATITAAMTAAINAVLEMPVVAADAVTTVTLTSKWQGASANDIQVAVTGSSAAGVSFAIAQLTGGLVNPDVDTALNQIGNVWESLVLNCLDIADTATLDKYSTFGEGRWGALVRKPLVVFTGNTAATVASATVVSDARKTDRVNAQLVSPGSNDLPLVVAARQLVRIARTANRNPPRDYGSQAADGLVPGTDGEQWNYAQRDEAVKKGSSTIEVKDGVVNLSDIVTFYHPTGDPIPAYRYVVDIIKLQTIIFNLDLIFASSEWDGAPLIPDAQATVNREAKTPKAAVSAVSAMHDSLGLNAIISNPASAKANTFASIDALNPKRLNLVTTVQLGGNTNIISVGLEFGFLFGSPPLAA